MALIFKRPLTAQPQGVIQLDTSNPLTRSPAFVLLPSFGKDLVSGTTWVQSGSSGVSVIGSTAGLAFKTPGGLETAGYIDLGTLAGPSVDIAAGPSTFVGIFNATGTSGVAIAERNDGDTSNAGWVFGYVSSSGLGFVREGSTQNTRKSITDTIVPGINILVVTYDGGFLASGLNVYLNGKLGTVAGTVDGSGTIGTDAGLHLYTGRRTFGPNGSHDGAIMLSAAFRRIWTPSEVQAFSANPWQIFKSPPRRYLLEAAASGSGTSTMAESSAGTSAQDDTVAFTATGAESSAGTDTQTATAPVSASTTESVSGTTTQDQTGSTTSGATESSTGTTTQDDTNTLTAPGAETSAGTTAQTATTPVSTGGTESSVGTTTQDETTGTAISRAATETTAGTTAQDQQQQAVPAGQGASGVRRWLIQYYTDYYEKRDKEKALKEMSKEVLQASAGVVTPRMVRERAPTPVVTLTPDASVKARQAKLIRETKQAQDLMNALQQAQEALASRPTMFSDDLHLRFEQGEEDDMLLLSTIL